MAKVQFLRGTAAQYAALASKDDNALYFITDERRIYKGAVPYTGGQFEAVTSFPATGEINKLYVNTADGAAKYWNGSAYQTVVMPQMSAVNTSAPSTTNLLTEKAIVDYVSAQIAAVDAAGIASTISGLSASIASNASAITTLNTTLGSATLSTTDQTVTGAINELHTGLSSAATNLAVTVASKEDNTVAASYEIKQGETVLGTINVPKDMVVQSGVVEIYTTETLPTGEGAPTTPGTYIVLTVANAANDKLYIPAEDLVDIYTAGADATEVQLAVNGTELTATLVDGGVATAKLADNAVTTAKVADANITKAKLAADVQASLDLADAALDDAKAYTDAELTWNTIGETTPVTPPEPEPEPETPTA